MAFKEKQPSEKKMYSISLKSTTGNTVGFINLSQQFIKAVVHKDPDTVTLEDLENLRFKGFANIQEFLSNLTIELSAPSHEVIAPDDF